MPMDNVPIIDDETQLRKLLARIIELEGYTVLQAEAAPRGCGCWNATIPAWCSAT